MAVSTSFSLSESMEALKPSAVPPADSTAPPHASTSSTDTPRRLENFPNASTLAAVFINPSLAALIETRASKARPACFAISPNDAPSSVAVSSAPSILSSKSSTAFSASSAPFFTSEASDSNSIKNVSKRLLGTRLPLVFAVFYGKVFVISGNRYDFPYIERIL